MFSKAALSGLKGKCNLFSPKMGLFRKGQIPVRYSSAVKRVEEPHMNHIPMPISHEVVYSKRQKGNNAVLLAGILFFSFSSFYVFNSGVIVANLTPPRTNPE